MGRFGGGGSGGGFGGGGFGGGGFGGGGFGGGGFSNHGGGGRFFGGGRPPMGEPGRGARSSGGNNFFGGMLGGFLGTRMARGFNEPHPPMDPMMDDFDPERNPQYPQGRAGASGCSGCGLFALILIIIGIALVITMLTMPFSCSSDIPVSTVERVALPGGSVQETEYYTDADGTWIRNSSELEVGLKEFYQLTGIQPYVVILPNNSITSQSQINTYARDLYGQLFNDQAHFLLVICAVYNSYGQEGYYYSYWGGAQTQSIMDEEAVGILIQYLDRYYYDSNLSEESMLSKAFADTAHRIMTVTPSPVISIAIVVGIGIVAIVIVIVLRQRKIQKERDQAHMEKILNTPLEKFEDQELEDLEKKYSDEPTPQP